MGFVFSVVDNNAVVTNLGTGPSNKVKRDIPVPPGYYILPTTPPPSLPGSRCAGADQTAVSKVPSPAQSSNGCGSDTFPSKYAPNLWFKNCCNMHDICYSKIHLSFYILSFSFDYVWKSQCLHVIQTNVAPVSMTATAPSWPVTWQPAMPSHLSSTLKVAEISSLVTFRVSWPLSSTGMQ